MEPIGGLLFRMPKREGLWEAKKSENKKGLNMRGTYEAFILVKVKGGRQYVCALNRQKKSGENFDQLSYREKQEYLHSRVIWN